MRFKLGLRPAEDHPNTIKFADILRADAPPLPPTPSKVYWEYKIGAGDWGMFGNAAYGDCFWAYIAHQIMSWTAHVGKIQMPSLDDVLAAYADCTGFDISTGTNDNGTEPNAGYEYCRTVGVGGHKIDGWCEVDSTNDAHVATANWLCGGIGNCFKLPANAQDQFTAGLPWDIDPANPDPAIEGGHIILGQGKGKDGETGITWAQRQQMGNPWLAKYRTNVFCAISLDQIGANSLAPSHINMNALRQAISQLKMG